VHGMSVMDWYYKQEMGSQHTLSIQEINWNIPNKLLYL